MRFLLLSLTLLAAVGCTTSGESCSCDMVAAESRCIEFQAPDNPLYAAQLTATCDNTLQGLCDSLGGTYEFGTSCPDEGLSATCEVDVASYVEEVHWYSTGGEPVDAASTEPEDDCSDNGTVTRY